MQDQMKKFKILAVDDNPVNLKFLGSLLKDNGYLLGFATNGKQALDVMQESPDFDLVLMDINMPVLNGIEAFEAIMKSEHCRDIPVIFLTAQNNIEEVVKCFELGAADYILKPFNTKELLSRVNTQLQLKDKSDQLKLYAKELEKFNITKDKFFSIISHDLRNPFGALQIISNMLTKSLDNNDINKSKELNDLLSNTIQSGFKLLDNLLQWSRSQAGKIKPRPIEIQLSPVVEEVVEMVAPHALGKNISIQNQVNDNLSLFADTDLLKTVLRNLISNAVKFTPAHGEVQIFASTQNNTATISIKDNGIGISEDISQRLFRIDGDITSNPGTAGEEGTGLGLIICHEFIEKMGGTIRVESTPAQGSEFIITIPHHEGG